MIKSPLRYPGGKSRAAKYIASMIPPDVREYREPFVGGASVFFYVRDSRNTNIEEWWLSDINEQLMQFWRITRDSPLELKSCIEDFIESYPDRKQLFQHLREQSYGRAKHQAAIYFLRNRMTFSGTTEAGGFSPQAAEKRLTPSSIERLVCASPTLQGVLLSTSFYTHPLMEKGRDVFLYLDPPYSNNTKSGLYGKGGNLHRGFNHEQFADTCRSSAHRWLITYDDSPYIRDLFSWAQITPYSLQYGMNNSSGKAAKGSELIITNYKIEE